MAPSSLPSRSHRRHPSPSCRHPHGHGHGTRLLIILSVLLASLPILDGLELGGDTLYREILRDETVLRLKELGKVRSLVDPVTGSSDMQIIFRFLIHFSSERYGNLVRLLGLLLVLDRVDDDALLTCISSSVDCSSWMSRCK